MKCSRWHRMMALYVSGDLSAARAKRVERHLGGCTSCRALGDALLADRKRLELLDARSFEGVDLRSVRGAVVAEIGTNRPSGVESRGIPRLAAAVAVLAVVAVLGITLSNRERREPVVAEGTPQPAAEVVEALPEPSVADPAVAVPATSDPPAAATRAPRPEPFTRVARGDAPAVRTASGSPSVPTEPMVMKILTDDPEVVIYWIVEAKGEEKHV